MKRASVQQQGEARNSGPAASKRVASSCCTSRPVAVLPWSVRSYNYSEPAARVMADAHRCLNDAADFFGVSTVKQAARAGTASGSTMTREVRGPVFSDNRFVTANVKLVLGGCLQHESVLAVELFATVVEITQRPSTTSCRCAFLLRDDSCELPLAAEFWEQETDECASAGLCEAATFRLIGRCVFAEGAATRLQCFWFQRADPREYAFAKAELQPALTSPGTTSEQ
eukprot:TRINITY_DN2761_c0_g1_i1.p1 TRINITY_DN2761_c0_g1~~TRINITY_DN2761_c0_g1_i1.p1  ORF type:complete len:227 (+),score=43.56 TRINITY_DN2761_c0_g1_i1:52-732(+)